MNLIKKISDKQARILWKYRKKRKDFLSIPANQLCAIELINCTRRATDIHHSGKKVTEEDWLDETKYIPCCRNCHNAVEKSPDLARELGIYNYKA